MQRNANWVCALRKTGDDELNCVLEICEGTCCGCEKKKTTSSGRGSSSDEWQRETSFPTNHTASASEMDACTAQPTQLTQVRTGKQQQTQRIQLEHIQLIFAIWAQGLWYGVCARAWQPLGVQMYVSPVIALARMRCRVLSVTEWEWAATALMATQRPHRCAERCFCWLRRRRRCRHNSFTIKNVGALAFALALAHVVAFMKCKRFACGFSCFLCCCKYSLFLVFSFRGFRQLFAVVVSCYLCQAVVAAVERLCVVSHNSNTFRCYVVEWVFLFFLSVYALLLLLVSVCFVSSCSIMRLLFSGQFWLIGNSFRFRHSCELLL